MRPSSPYAINPPHPKAIDNGALTRAPPQLDSTSRRSSRKRWRPLKISRASNTPTCRASTLEPQTRQRHGDADAAPDAPLSQGERDTDIDARTAHVQATHGGSGAAPWVDASQKDTATLRRGRASADPRQVKARDQGGRGAVLSQTRIPRCSSQARSRASYLHRRRATHRPSTKVRRLVLYSLEAAA